MRVSRESAETRPLGAKLTYSINVGDVEIVKLDSIKPWKKNPRTDRGIPFIRKLLRVYGQQSPLQVWREDMTIRKGNTTWKAMKEEGFKEVAVIFKEFKDESEADAYALSDNAASDQGEWDQEKRFELMKSEHLSEKTSVELGITDKEYNSLMLSAIKPEKLPDVDIEGDQTGLSFSVILQFDDEDSFMDFKESLGINVKHQRLIKYSTLLEHYQLISESKKPSDNERVRSTRTQRFAR